jgi:hypothetical protein
MYEDRYVFYPIHLNFFEEFAMRLRPEIAAVLEAPGDFTLVSLRRMSNCVVSIGSDMLNGRCRLNCMTFHL